MSKKQWNKVVSKLQGTKKYHYYMKKGMRFLIFLTMDQAWEMWWLDPGRWARAQVIMWRFSTTWVNVGGTRLKCLIYATPRIWGFALDKISSACTGCAQRAAYKG